MKIYIMTDMEGCAGILNCEDWVRPGGCYYENGRRILTEEVNAAVAGFREGGATGILVADGHGTGGIDPLLLDEQVSLQRGWHPEPYPFGLDSSFDAAAWVGQHAKAGTDCSHITHTGWFSTIDLTVNGISVGEYGQVAFCASELGVPCIFASGEDAFCREAETLTPGVVTVGVKRGIRRDGLEYLTTDQYRAAKLAAVHIHHNEACRRIRAGALQAMEMLGKEPESFRFPQLEKPYILIQRLRADEKNPPHTERAEHPDSLIGLMNAERIKTRSKYA